jgi:hypothetical protein
MDRLTWLLVALLALLIFIGWRAGYIAGVY